MIVDALQARREKNIFMSSKGWAKKKGENEQCISEKSYPA